MILFKGAALSVALQKGITYLKIIFEHKEIIPVTKYGGTERILFWHMKELAKRGHKVSLIGNSQSNVEKFGIKLIPRKEKEDWRSLLPVDADILHLQYSGEYDISIPIINTVHGNGQVGEVFTQNSMFVSKDHAKRHNSNQFIHNAIDFEEFPFQERSFKGLNNFMFLAKGSWSVKNLKDCIRASKGVKKKLHVAGGRSLLPSRFIVNHGIVDQTQKMKIFADSDALLFPVRWHEPFGIAIIEAMAQSLPVIGSPYGSLPELITQETGIICQSYDDFVSTLNSNKIFDPRTIRKYSEKKFSIERYTDQYLSAYEKVISGEKLNATTPKTLSSKNPEDLLPF